MKNYIETNRVPFLNTYIDNLSFAEAEKKIIELAKDNTNFSYVVTPNSDIIVKMENNARLKRICESADLILPDGQILVKLSKKTRFPLKERVCMTDFVWNVVDACVKNNFKVCFFGGKPDVLQKAVANIVSKQPLLKIVGAISPTIGFEKNRTQLNKYVALIKKTRADILIVFLGCPKQEEFIYCNKEKYEIPLSIPMGGCVDFLSGSVKRAPKWMQKIGFEWFYRFLQEPKRMFKRYFIDDIKIFKFAKKFKN